MWTFCILCFVASIAAAAYARDYWSRYYQSRLAAVTMAAVSSKAGSFQPCPTTDPDAFLEYLGRFMQAQRREHLAVLFLRDGRPRWYWLIGGVSTWRVSVGLEPKELLAICRRLGYDTVWILHNHPGITANRWPSTADRSSCSEFRSVLRAGGIQSREAIYGDNQYGTGYWRWYGPPIPEQIMECVGLGAGHFQTGSGDGWPSDQGGQK